MHCKGINIIRMELIRETTYQAASKVAAIIETHFFKHLAIAKRKWGRRPGCAPDAGIVEKMIDVAFWASLRKEEGNSTKISLAFLKPSQAGKPLLFEKRLPLSSKVLSKLAPRRGACGVHVGVWHEEGELYIWGTTIKLPNYCFVLDVSEPALLVVKQRRIIGLGKFTNVASAAGRPGKNSG